MGEPNNLHSMADFLLRTDKKVGDTKVSRDFMNNPAWEDLRGQLVLFLKKGRDEYFPEEPDKCLYADAVDYAVRLENDLKEALKPHPAAIQQSHELTLQFTDSSLVDLADLVAALQPDDEPVKEPVGSHEGLTLLELMLRDPEPAPHQTEPTLTPEELLESQIEQYALIVAFKAAFLQALKDTNSSLTEPTPPPSPVPFRPVTEIPRIPNLDDWRTRKETANSEPPTDQS